LVQEYDDVYRKVVNEIDDEDKIDDDLNGIVRKLGLNSHEFGPIYKIIELEKKRYNLSC
jgi:hypothetical protein